MSEFTNILSNPYIILGIIVINIVLIILYIYDSVKLKKINEKYEKFMKKLGNGNIEEDLKIYLDKVENIENKNKEILNYCDFLDKEVEKSIKKIGIVRYNAFKDTGSDLSFALALLNDHNDGVILNGIYSRDTSNIYAKPIKNAISKYTLSEVEKEALDKAINCEESAN